MAEELPIACTLTGVEYPRRLAEMSALGAAALLDSELTTSRALLRFSTGPGTRSRIDAIVEAEARCCAFLEMTVTDEPGSIVLTIEGPRDAALVVSELHDAFRGAERAA